MPRRNRLPRNRRVQRIKGVPVRAERTLADIWAALVAASVTERKS